MKNEERRQKVSRNIWTQNKSKLIKVLTTMRWREVRLWLKYQNFVKWYMLKEYQFNFQFTIDANMRIYMRIIKWLLRPQVSSTRQRACLEIKGYYTRFDLNLLHGRCLIFSHFDHSWGRVWTFIHRSLFHAMTNTFWYGLNFSIWKNESMSQKRPVQVYVGFTALFVWGNLWFYFIFSKFGTHLALTWTFLSALAVDVVQEKTEK